MIYEYSCLKLLTIKLFCSVIATPGRFLHVIMEMDLKLSSMEYVVFDEADRSAMFCLLEV